ncbi:MAG: ABC transporter permease subunit [Gammaproteobacteria bacterium]|nr:ABC transporter permease subunit [SAR86 cluster bacterium]MCH2474151.1 ABC transporter permease subunit [Gammaproteobacteria bacterium]MCS5547689.1 ABC transporter permease subunit [SAR86 cluster bacterium]GIS75018.1 MAG: peptide ABC transporter permease [Gammaproteobacteria bacterium]GIT61406.1 MAG: peptide ABC transporter permease [Gammaproteobacteria bacterium]
MISLILRRLGTAIPVLLAVITLTFVMVHSAPGGPFDEEKAVSPEVLVKLNERYNLNEPLVVQYFDYLGNVLQGDFGPSFRYPSRSVTELISIGLPITFELALYAILFALMLGIIAGVISSLRPNTAYDYVPMTIAMAGICIPSIVLGPSLTLIFGIQLNWLPVTGWGDIPGDKVLPTITLGTAYAAYCARLTRGGMLEILNQDFIRTARAKGISEFRVVVVHALRGGLTPVIAFLGPAMAGLLAGSFVVETIFGIPGLGRFYVEAAFNRDYTMILGTSIFFSCLIISFNLLSDLVAASLNPKLRDQ